MNFIAFCLILMGTTLSFSQEPIQALYGPEFTFTDTGMLRAAKGNLDLDNPENLRKLDLWRDKILEICEKRKECKIENTKNKHGVKAYKFTFDDGWWFQISVDPSCLEVQTQKASVEEFQSRMFRLVLYVFSSATDLGFYPHRKTGGGHINVDALTAFNKDARLFRNFLVHRANHPELADGVWGNDLANAPPISALNYKAITHFERAIEWFDQSKGSPSIEALANTVKTSVYITNPAWVQEGEDSIWKPDYYQDINFDHLNSHRRKDLQRLELRGFAPQKGFDEFMLQIRYLDKLLNYLNNLDEDLKTNIPDIYSMTPEEKFSRFVADLIEIGLDPVEYKVFGPRVGLLSFEVDQILNKHSVQTPCLESMEGLL